MISLDQVRQLETRIKKIVDFVKALNAENETNKRRVEELEADLDKLRSEAMKHQADEEKLEVSFQGVINILDEVEETTAGLESPVSDKKDIANDLPEPVLEKTEEAPLESGTEQISEEIAEDTGEDDEQSMFDIF